MKHFKQLTLLILTLSLLLCGCGGNSGATPKSIVNSDSPVIGYMISGIDKEKVPSSVYVFQKGKVKEYDTRYTLGELSKMTDEEVLTALQKEYLEQELESTKQSLESSKKTAKNYQEKIDELNKEYEYTWDSLWEDASTEAYTMLEGKRIESSLLGDMANMLRKKGFREYKTFNEAWKALEASDPDTNFCKSIWNSGYYTVLYDVVGNTSYFTPGIEAYDQALEKVVAAKEASREKQKIKQEEKLAETNTKIAEYENEIKELEKGEKDVPKRRAIINIVSNSSGNEVSEEQIVILTKKSVKRTISLNPSFAQYCEEGSEIYDSIYYGYSDGGYTTNYLLLRGMSNLKFDAVDTKDIYVDLKDFKQFFE